MRKSVKRAVVIGTALAVTTGAGAAYAAWLATGTGAGTAKAVTAQALTTGDAELTSALYPGATSSLKVLIKNPNAYPVQIDEVVVATAGITSDKAGCTSASIEIPSAVDGVRKFAVSQLVGANNGEATVTLSGAIKMVGNAQNACQDATFTVPVTFTGASAAS
jgi:hypothetical protein